MTSVSSVRSFTSQRSRNVLDQVASMSTSKIHSLEGIFSNEEMRVAWNGFGLYVSKNMRMGRGVAVPKLGVFTFTPPEIRLKGVTNPNDRDLRPRNPVFIIDKNFVKGMEIKSGIFFHQDFGSGIRAYSLYGANGEVPIAKANFTEVASYANMTKDNVETAVNRVIKHLSDKARAGGSCAMDIPSVGTFMVRNMISAVKFTEFLQRDTRNVLSQSLKDRKSRSDFSLTKDNLKKFAILNETHQRLANKPMDFLKIDNKTKSYLKDQLGLHFDDSADPMRRTITGFDRSLNTKNFKGNASMMIDSQMSKFNQSVIRKTLGGTEGEFRTTMKYDYNMALKLLRQWIFGKSLNSQDAFLQFMKLAKGKQDLMSVLTDTDIWTGCKQISLDITEQQAHELFRLLDFNQDGVVSLEDWVTIIKFDSNALLRKLKAELSRNRMTNDQILVKSGLSGIKNVDVFKLQKALLALSKLFKEDQAYNLSRYLCGDDRTVSVQKVVDQLGGMHQHITRVIAGADWEKRFLERVKRVMNKNDIYEQELANKFGVYDSRRSGQISQTQFKDVLTSLGITLTVTEIIKAMRQLSTSNQTVNYQEFIDKLKDIQVDQEGKGDISYEDFLHKINPFLSKADFDVKLPISINALASQLQSRLFVDDNESTLRKHLKRIDVDDNGEISKEDIQAFKHGRTQKFDQTLSPQQAQTLIKQLKQKLISKRLSFHQLFKTLDVSKKGLITPKEWDNIDKVFPMNPANKQILFEHIDKQNLSMIDYKAFLDALQTNKKYHPEDKYDWVDNCIAKLKEWFNKSNLQPVDAFKVADRDFDSYIGSKDLVSFLQDTLKYQPKQISNQRIMKLLKVMDTYKRGKVDMVDFVKIITSDGSNTWIQNAKQQVGLAISRKFKSLHQAFNDIGRTQKNLLYSNFQKWIQSNGILTGFMMNESMLKELFASLDPHKKGYLSESDFGLAFGKFDWKSSLSMEFIETLQAKFKDIKDAFKHLSGYSNLNSLNRQQFNKSLSQLFGSRFKSNDQNEIWKQLSSGHNSISYDRFNQMYGRKWSQRTDALSHDYPRDSWAYQDYDIIKGTVSRSLQHAYNQSDDLEVQCRKMLQSVKNILRSSPKTLEQVFLEFDKTNRGTVTNLEFRHAFRNLNVALTSKEIDLILNSCDIKVEGMIDWRQFIKKFDIGGDRKKIIDRAKTRMQRLSDDIHFYMISPKDAYRKYNNPNTGFMTFEEFYKMVKELYSLSGKSLPEFSIIREVFDFIDVRGDNNLDYQEWVQTFKNYQSPSMIQGTQAPKKSRKEDEAQNPQPDFMQSGQFQQLTKLIGRNRKYILDKLQTLQKSGTAITLQQASKVLRQLAQQSKLQINDDMYRSFLSFAMRGDRVDYNTMLDSYKFRSDVIAGFPKKQTF